jgi:UDP-glucose 4-epimerase
MAKILVTGGAGFIGSHLVEELSKNNEVVVLDKLIHGNKLPDNFKVTVGDIRDYDLVESLSKDCDVIYHLAAYVGVDFVGENSRETMEVDFLGIFNVCKAAQKNNVKKIIFTSTSGIYDEHHVPLPKSGYAMAKRNSEMYLKYFSEESGICCVALRLFNVYGDRQDDRMVIKRFYTQAINNQPITIYDDGKQTRDFTYIKDCVTALILVGEKVNNFGIFDLGVGVEETIESLAIRIKKLFNSNSIIENITTPNKLKQFQIKKRKGNSSELFNIINYSPTTNLNDGLLKTFMENK